VVSGQKTPARKNTRMRNVAVHASLLTTPWGCWIAENSRFRAFLGKLLLISPKTTLYIADSLSKKVFLGPFPKFFGSGEPAQAFTEGDR
jgi:hypothetical protein